MDLPQNIQCPIVYHNINCTSKLNLFIMYSTQVREVEEGKEEGEEKRRKKQKTKNKKKQVLLHRDGNTD